MKTIIGYNDTESILLLTVTLFPIPNGAPVTNIDCARMQEYDFIHLSCFLCFLMLYELLDLQSTVTISG